MPAIAAFCTGWSEALQLTNSSVREAEAILTPLEAAPKFQLVRQLYVVYRHL
jgi:hypothetical protein